MSKRQPSKPVKMTDLWVQNYRKPGLSPSDSESGLRLYVARNGRKSWVRFYRHPISRKLVKQTLPFMGLAEARHRVSDDKLLQSKNIDPIEDARTKKQAAIEKTEGALSAVAKRFIDLAASKLRSRQYYKNTLKNHILPKLGERPIGEIKRSEITAVLDHVEQNSGASAADAAKRVLSALMNWHQDRGEFTSPMVRMKSRQKPIDRARTRSLSDDELRAVWIAAGDERVGVYGQVIRFMILCGARRSEASGLRREAEIEVVRDNGDQFAVWRLPAKRSKSKKKIVRPLSRAALDIVESMPIISDSDFVFTTTGRSPVNMSYRNRWNLLTKISGVRDWRLHDLRRVFRSLCSRCRVPFEIAELLLGHSVPLQVRTYDQHSHLPAMAEAVEKVAAEIDRIVEREREGKVIRLR